jgi:hypothetical protein
MSFISAIQGVQVDIVQASVSGGLIAYTAIQTIGLIAKQQERLDKKFKADMITDVNILVF